jgi:hypothetical protein
MSEAELDAGSRWGLKLSTALSEINFGILCLTATNMDAPWLMFEAGALAKSINGANVCPYLIGMKPANIPEGPLTQFQAKVADRSGTFDLVRALNSSLVETPLPEERLNKTFEMCWPDLEQRLTNLPFDVQEAPRRNTEDMLAEILDVVRSLGRSMGVLPHGLAPYLMLLRNAAAHGAAGTDVSAMAHLLDLQPSHLKPESLETLARAVFDDTDSQAFQSGASPASENRPKAKARPAVVAKAVPKDDDVQ